MLRGKTIEEIVNKWSNELETHVKEFNKYAAEVSVWDRALIENSNSLAAIYSHVLAAEREQAEVDQSLDHIEQQQKDLAATLDTYEKVTEEIFGGQGGSLRALDTGPADTERDKNYMLAADLQTHLDDLSGSLTQMIEAVNGLTMPSGSSNSGDPSASGNERSQEDPMAQISQILSSHLDSLQWIDTAAREIEGKITEVERRVGESGHGSGYGVGIGGGLGGSGISGLGARSRSFRA
ncbi:Nsp1-like C-terminal region-domain-containing protein [Lentinula guzmanii]|uniref:Nucleoporin NSP1 n=1 Tax=Lentinula guzmanii TaxID=2804957 RepID=A0AA38J6W3_9AGAR|nr:Nsp1-like C-terminal region-domain-containing protein [Lentinula guzmanii]